LKSFIIGLLVGIGIVVLVTLVLAFVRPRLAWLTGRRAGQAITVNKVMVATLGAPFNPKAIALAAAMAGESGVIQTVYILEIPLNQPLESEAEAELAIGMEALEEAEKIGRQNGVRVLPKLEKTRLGSKAVVEMQKDEGFDAIILEVKLGSRSQRVGRKVAEYVQEHASCIVLVVSEQRDE
jgi:nucleotide-binding universal stress UspA family protein